VPQAFTVGKWHHVVITADNNDNMRPPISVYINNKKVFTKPSGYLPQVSVTSRNYIGKSNWSRVADTMNNKDELFQGALFDLRAYKIPLKTEKIVDFYEWGLDKLGLDEERSDLKVEPQNIGLIKKVETKAEKEEREKEEKEKNTKKEGKSQWEEYGKFLETRGDTQWEEGRAEV